MYSVGKLGLIEKERNSIIPYIGQPLHKYFEERLKQKNGELEKAVKLYREYYSDKGIYENRLYDGIPELLEHLNKNDKSVFLVTGKPIVYVKIILQYFKIDSYFSKVYGSGSGVINSSKEDLITRTLIENKLEPKRTVMIGDTKYDVNGAKENEIKSIAVTYGYGSIKELKAAKPDYIVNIVEELSEILK